MIQRILIILSLLVFGAVPFASAHTFQNDGPITVLMHTDPDDDVVAGAPATMYFSVFDQTNKFLATNCFCNIIVTDGTKLLLNQKLLPNNSASSIFAFQLPFVFPSKAIYTVIMTGAPKAPDQFHAFQVQYKLPVAKSIPDPKPNPHAAGMAEAIIAILILAGYVTLYLRHKISYN